MVSEVRLRRWMRKVRNGSEPPGPLIEELRRLPFENLGFARPDTHRTLRRGVPEAIYCDGKTAAQIIEIARRAGRSGEPVLLTRLRPRMFEAVHRALPRLRYDPVARLAYDHGRPRRARRGCVLVLTGGTSDGPVAEEAALTLEVLGSRVTRLCDVGVAGVHRLLGHWRLLRRARVVVAVAGMDGALASVVAGLVACPVIAVPTSVGYGASFRGLGALLTMLNGCAPGIGVVNIDNGFGAGYLAHVINSSSRRPG